MSNSKVLISVGMGKIIQSCGCFSKYYYRYALTLNKFLERGKLMFGVFFKMIKKIQAIYVKAYFFRYLKE